jgi:cell division septation protein DedD
VWSSARIGGRVVSDAHTGVAGIVITATAPGGRTFTATTDGEGAFTLDTPDGDYTLSLSTESLPPGYTVSGTDVHQVEARADQPRHVAFEVRALRTIAGTIPGAREVRIQPPGRTAPADAAGNFVFRSLPSGTFTISALVNGRTVSRTVTLPPQPASETIAVLDMSPPAPHAAPARSAAAFRILIGAYRVVENALSARTQAEGLGLRAEIDRKGTLNVVSIGPVASREEAEQQAARLHKAGLEALVVPDQSRSGAR